MPKVIDPALKSSLIFSGEEKNRKEKDSKNYYEVELSHSQSENVFRSMDRDRFDIQERIIEADDEIDPNYEDQHEKYQEE